MDRAVTLRGTSIRARLLTAFALVGLPPVLLLAWLVSAQLTRSFDQAAAQRAQVALRAAQGRIADLRRQAAAQVAAVANEDLPAALPAEEGDAGLAETFGARRQLPALEILDAAGRIVSSRHWAAGLGLADPDRPLEPAADLRLETAAEGYGASQRLALMPSQPALWRGEPVTVRGGLFLDTPLVTDMGSMLGAAVGLRDDAGGRWWASSGQTLAAWSGPGRSALAGRVTLGDGPYAWAAAPLAGATSLVVAVPTREEDQVLARVRRLTLGVGLAALLAGLAAAAVLANAFARPVRSLAEGAQRIAGGDLEGSVAVRSADELGALADAFNRMTRDLRDSRERLLQAERVAAWREMARRLAHELKNPIFPIQLSIETLRRVEGKGDAAAFTEHFREASDTILDELNALKRIIDEFSEFARMPRPQLSPIDVNAVVQQVLALYAAQAEGVSVERDLASSLPEVEGDRGLLARALGNLVANALEAMPDGGVLSVRTALATGAVEVRIADTGPGLTEEQRTRLFTPYFTTKKGGTGLGLAIAQGVVSDHGGRIEVVSAPGQGTVFRLLFPVPGGAAPVRPSAA